MGRAYSANVKERNAYRMLAGKLEEKRPLGRPRYRSEDNIEMDSRETGWTGLIGSRQGQVEAIVNIVMNIRVP
jgi:hypothetical protein